MSWMQISFHHPPYENHLNVFDRGNPFGGRRPACPRLPRQFLSSFLSKLRERALLPPTVRPSL